MQNSTMLRHGAVFLFLLSGQRIHAYIQGHRYPIEGFYREIVAGLIALNLSDEIMRKPSHFRQLSRGHAPLLAVLSDVFSYRVID